MIFKLNIYIKLSAKNPIQIFTTISLFNLQQEPINPFQFMQFPIMSQQIMMSSKRFVGATLFTRELLRRPEMHLHVGFQGDKNTGIAFWEWAFATTVSEIGFLAVFDDFFGSVS